MRKYFVLICLLFFHVFILAQHSSWQLINQYKLQNISAWDVDPIGNVIAFSNGVLYKLDTNFKLVFTQSENSNGFITKVDAQHSLKTLLFSENQQTISFVDNTLSFQPLNIYLPDFGINLATAVCYSSQTQTFWVYDAPKSRLIKFTHISSMTKSSEISNISFVTGENQPTSIEESNHQLILFYKNNGIFIFDSFGSLVRKYDFPNAIAFCASEHKFFILTQNSVISLDRTTGNRTKLDLPNKNINDIRVLENKIYFITDEGILQYKLIEK